MRFSNYIIISCTRCQSILHTKSIHTYYKPKKDDFLVDIFSISINRIIYLYIFKIITQLNFEKKIFIIF